jgi:two-component system sensor histidine kinase QseC
MSWGDRLPRSLRGRLALGVLAGALLVLSVSFVVLHLVIRNELYRHLDEDMLNQMRAVAEYAAANPGRERVSEFMPQFRTRSHQDFFQVWDGAGRTLARSDSSAGRDLPRLGAAAGVPTYHDLVLPDGHHGRAVSQTFDMEPDDPRRLLTVVVAEETENLDRLESRIHQLLLAIAVATAAAMLLIARYAVLRGLRPVESFARSLENVDPEDPQARLETGPLPTELQPVALRFSGLLGRLLDALAREKRYARNVAHELRNPLAEIRLLADVGSDSQDPDACQVAIRDIRSAAAEMERIVDALMALTRYEAGLESPQPEPINLAAELRREVRRQAVAAEQRGLMIVLDLPEEAWVHTDSALAHRLLANLFGNAVSHSPHGATVRVAMSGNGDLSFANPAPHLSPADLPRLRERFYHIDTGEKGTHAGLGLSLADAIARVLGLTIRLGLQEDGCLVAEVHGFRALETATASHDVSEPS